MSINTNSRSELRRRGKRGRRDEDGDGDRRETVENSSQPPVVMHPAEENLPDFSLVPNFTNNSKPVNNNTTSDLDAGWSDN